jgi:hypothetical protein
MPVLPKPEHAGQFDGQSKTVTIKVPKVGPNGRIVRFPYTSPTGQTLWMTVKESRVVVDWVWDARAEEWVTESEWLARRPSPNAGKVLVKKTTPLHRALAERQKTQLAEMRRLEKKHNRNRN